MVHSRRKTGGLPRAADILRNLKCQTVLPRDPLDRIAGTEERAHRLSLQTEHQIHGDNDEPHHAGVARIDQAEQPLGASGRESGKPFPARIDVDDSIERDDLGRTDQIGQVDEVAVQIGDATVVAAALALLSRRVADRGRARSPSTAVTAVCA